VAYVFADGRGKGEIAAQLVDYAGILQVDGYVAYKSLAKDAREAGTIRLAFCLAHARRRFVKVYKTTKSPFAQEVIERIAAIYAIEERVRGTSAEIRLAARKNETRPLMAELKTRLTEVLKDISSKSPLAEAINYTLGHWDGLTVFLTDGRVEVDTNTVERSMRPIAVLESLCIPSSSVCKHWNRVVVSDATRATFSGYRGFDRFRRQVVGPNLVWRAGHNLHRGQHAGFEQAAYRVACGA
jgi:hypothetical protein